MSYQQAYRALRAQGEASQLEEPPSDPEASSLASTPVPVSPPQIARSLRELKARARRAEESLAAKASATVYARRIARDVALRLDQDFPEARSPEILALHRTVLEGRSSALYRMTYWLEHGSAVLGALREMEEQAASFRELERQLAFARTLEQAMGLYGERRF